MYMRSLPSFGYICSIKSPQNMIQVHMSTRYEPVIMSIYRISNTFLNYNSYSCDFELQDCGRLNKVCDL